MKSINITQLLVAGSTAKDNSTLTCSWKAQPFWDPANNNWQAAATCKQEPVNWMKCGMLDLNYCYGVDGSGSLVKQEHGNFSENCIMCHFDQQTTAFSDGVAELDLQCSCKDSDGHYQVSRVRPSEDLLSDENLLLSCFGHEGNECFAWWP